MAYVPGYRHDVFVSYARVDNDREPLVDQGWVSTLVVSLKKLLAKKLGRAEADFWFDVGSMPGNGKVPTELERALRASATLLTFLSPGYLASDWCRQERRIFAEQLGGEIADRVFLLHLDRVERPEEFREIVGYQFWLEEPDTGHIRTTGWPVPDPRRDGAYYRMVDDLACALARKLQSMMKPPPPEEEKPDAVYLAEVTDDLDEQRDTVRRYLEQAGLTVLPQALYPRAAQEFRRALERDLSKSRLFVQLLSGVAGKRSLELPLGYAGLQYECAKGMKILQWRSPELALDAVTDEKHRQFMASPHVQAVDFEEFKRSIVQWYERKETPSVIPIVGHPRLVFVNADENDRQLASRIAATFSERGYIAALPSDTGSPADVRKDFESVVNSCDAIVIVYETSTKFWVRDQVFQLFRLIRLRDTPTPRLAIYQGPPPPPRDQIEVHWPGVRYIQTESDVCSIFDGAA